MDRAGPRVGMLCSTYGEVDGILDYATGLGEALARMHGLHVKLVLRRSGGWSTRRLGASPAPERAVTGLAVALLDCDAVMLHYNPFSWGRWGFAPWLAPSLTRLRLCRPELALGVVVHERYVPLGDVRATTMGIWQWMQFHAVLRAATVAFGSTDPWTIALRAETRAPVARLPICSNLPDARSHRAAARAHLKLDRATLCVTTFGTRHSTRLTGHVERAVGGMARAGLPIALLNLGANAPVFPGVEDAVRVIAPGRLPASEISECLAASDLYLAPFVDGASPRRTTLMAALQHGLPIVGTDGSMTGPTMRSAREALTLTPAADADAFAAAALGLALDPERRARQGAAARRLYERDHDWPVACEVALAGLSAGRRREPRSSV
jgi:hypothetical protein